MGQETNRDEISRKLTDEGEGAVTNFTKKNLHLLKEKSSTKAVSKLWINTNKVLLLMSYNLFLYKVWNNIRTSIQKKMKSLKKRFFQKNSFSSADSKK